LKLFFYFLKIAPMLCGEGNLLSGYNDFHVVSVGKKIETNFTQVLS
jgi:hypothetical protein